jgi:hypothetical protein
MQHGHMNVKLGTITFSRKNSSMKIVVTHPYILVHIYNSNFSLLVS